MVSVRSIPESDLEAAHRMHERFTGQDEPFDRFRARYAATPELFVGAYDGGDLVGVCLGWPRGDGEVELAGLGVEPSLRREGIGSRLVAALEDRAADLGVERVTVGSAGGYVDRFYAANGYVPEHVLVRSDPEELPENYREMGFDVVEERTDGETKKLYVAADTADADSRFLDAVREAFGDDEAVYVMAKTVG